MEQSKQDYITGIRTLPAGQPFPDELFYAVFEVEDVVERSQFVEALRAAAKEVGRFREFNNVYKAFVTDYAQRQKETGLTTAFTEQPVQLNCGEWHCRDTGVTAQRYDKNGLPQTILACPHPILPLEILKNVDTHEERITLAYFKYGEWQRISVDREVCADAGKIVAPLSRHGIEVTSENAKNLVRYLSDCVSMNPVTLTPKASINRLGWVGQTFMPYAEGIVYEGDRDFESLYRNIGQAGDETIWRDHCAGLRKNLIVRLAFAASAASVLLERLHALPFVFHLWSGESGTCKTVTVMAAMSLWGNPAMGGLVKTMNTTKVGLLRNAAFLYSLPYAGDELQTMKDKWTTNFDQLIYQITEGIDRGRGRASGGVEETKTWRNSFLFTGEEPITKQNSRGGSKNRVIEVEASEQLLPDGNGTVSLLTRHYGFGGPRLIAWIQKKEPGELEAAYKELFDALCKLDTTEKQAMSMACLLLADRMLCECLFPEESPLQIEQVKEYLRSAKEVDVTERAYLSTLNWISRNPIRFEKPDAASVNRGECWGKLEDGVAIINKDVLCDWLDSAGFDYTAVARKWSAQGYLLKNSQGKFVHQTKVYGLKASYVKLKLDQEARPDPDGFLAVGDQEELPFV